MRDKVLLPFGSSSAEVHTEDGMVAALFCGKGNKSWYLLPAALKRAEIANALNSESQASNYKKNKFRTQINTDLKDKNYKELKEI